MHKANDLDLYDREAGNWWVPGSALSVLQSMNPPRFEFFDRFVQDWNGKKVLDVGCGGGFTCEFMARRGAQVTGIDRSALSIAAAAEHARQSGLHIRYLAGAGEELPVQDGAFDVVTCVDVLEHVRDFPLVIQEIHRVLRPGGIFLFDTINKTMRSRFVMIWMLERILKQIPRGTHDWRLFIPPERMKTQLIASGFEPPELAGFEIKGVDKGTGKVKASIGRNLSVMYIGKTRKPELGC
jgi:2-polyprenyl-6-hydroxyphenyl methylase/3-demethylubiquinone-9 3-methyltransferase